MAPRAAQTVVSDPRKRRILVRALDGDEGLPPLLAYDPSTDAWTTSDVAVPGYHPALTLASSRLLVPDEATPIVGAPPP